MTAPTIGQTIRYWPVIEDDFPHDAGQPLPATVVAVRANGMVDVDITDTAGDIQHRAALPFIGPGDDKPEDWGWCEA